MPEPIGPDFFYDVISVSTPSITADSARVAFVKETVDRESAATSSQIVVADVSSGALRDFTHGPKDSRPRWSPDGSELGFLREDDNEKKQLWVIPAGFGEARQITEQPGGVSDFRWSPDGSQILFQSIVDPRDEDPDSDKKPLVITQLRYKADGSGLRGEGRSHLFVVVAAGGEARRLTEGDFDSYGGAWSPDGSQIAFLSARHPDREFASRTEAYTIPAGGGKPKMISGDLYAVGGVAWSPDGDGLALLGTQPIDDGGSCSVRCQSWLFVVEPDGGTRRITDDSIYPVVEGFYDHSAGELTWTPEGKIVFAGDAGGQSYICSADLSDGAVSRLTRGGVQITGSSITPDGGRAAAAATSSDDLGDIVIYDLSDGGEKRLTAYNAEWLGQHPPAKVEKFTYERDGVELEARLYFPPGFDEAGSYPLVLDVHGGPHSAFYDAFYPLHQVFAGAGYVVLAINPQGSSTYGRDFACAAHAAWGGTPYEELMQGVELVAERPCIDAERVVMHGSSYGGYMGSWMAGHTDRFRAIVIAAPVTNLVSFYGTSDIGVHFTEVELEAGRFDGPDTHDAWVRQSPLTYAKNVTTPVLILHGESDDRVPIEQGEQYFTALRRLGKEVEFVRLPDTSHGLFRNPNLRLREEYFRHALAWFERHLAR